MGHGSAHVYLETQRCKDEKSIDASLQKIATQAKYLDLQDKIRSFLLQIFTHIPFFPGKKL